MKSKKMNARAIGEFSVDTNGTNYLVIYGTHINGGWCAIPNHSIACEISEPSDMHYNAESLRNAGVEDEVAKKIAEGIKMYDAAVRRLHNQRCDR